MDFLPLLFFFLVIVPSSIIHEYAHGWMADQLGDPTARYAGRLSLNPKVHIDKWGTILMPLILFLFTFQSAHPFLFAYAKPVPYNPYNLKNQKTGPVWVALAGPTSNLILALLFGIFIQLFLKFGVDSQIFIDLLGVIVYGNILLAIFNLVPIPPLDGSKLLYALLPDSQYKIKMALERYSFVILLAFIFFGFKFITPIIYFLTSLFTGGVSLF
jgi:Zn-dependent protease